MLSQLTQLWVYSQVPGEIQCQRSTRARVLQHIVPARAHDPSMVKCVRVMLCYVRMRYACVPYMRRIKRDERSLIYIRTAQNRFVSRAKQTERRKCECRIYAKYRYMHHSDIRYITTTIFHVRHSIQYSPPSHRYPTQRREDDICWRAKREIGSY